ncbi:hypothetical protein C8F01DRAFT_1257817 [Mycena amicta]|nr:hypothetical protein C8F01DRAFT_1257817 [Mycena amicta]
MSDSNLPYPVLERPRVEIACTKCRKSKTKCMSDSPDHPCRRCRVNGWECQYLPMRQTPESVTHSGDPPRHRRRPDADAINFPAGTFTDISLVHPYAADSDSGASTGTDRYNPSSPLYRSPSSRHGYPRTHTSVSAPPNSYPQAAHSPYGYAGPSTAPPTPSGYHGGYAQPQGYPGYYNSPPAEHTMDQQQFVGCRCSPAGPCYCGLRGY